MNGKGGLVILCVLSHVYSQVGFSEVDMTQYEAGRTQFEVLKSQSQMPKYGKCWTNTLSSMQRGCAHLTADMQARLALSYLNCFLQIQGSNRMYFCDDHLNTTECMRNITESDSSSLATFFTHTQNICYFLQSQKWQENTQATISRLSKVSDEVAENLSATTNLQHETLNNQKVIMEQTENLRKTVSQLLLFFNDIFDLQKMILGKFSWLFSIMYYPLSILLSYLLTSTPRTSGARFWMFGILTLNIIVEGLIIYLYTSGRIGEAIYNWHSFCRICSTGLALVVLVVHAVRYRDLNTINHKLLRDIKADQDRQRQVTALNNELLRAIKEEMHHLRGQQTNPHLPGDEVDHLPLSEDQLLTPASHQTTSRIDQFHTSVTEQDVSGVSTPLSPGSSMPRYNMRQRSLPQTNPKSQRRFPE